MLNVYFETKPHFVEWYVKREEFNALHHSHGALQHSHGALQHSHGALQHRNGALQHSHDALLLDYHGLEHLFHHHVQVSNVQHQSLVEQMQKGSFSGRYCPHPRFHRCLPQPWHILTVDFKRALNFSSLYGSILYSHHVLTTECSILLYAKIGRIIL